MGLQCAQLDRKATARRGHVRKRQARAAPEDPRDLADGPLLRGEQAQRAFAEDPVHARVAQRERLGVGGDEADPAARVGISRVGRCDASAVV